MELYCPPKEDGNGWQNTFIGDNGMACEDAVVTDLDGDKKLDVVAAGRRSKNLKVYWNLQP